MEGSGKPKEVYIHAKNPDLCDVIPELKTRSEQKSKSLAFSQRNSLHDDSNSGCESHDQLDPARDSVKYNTSPDSTQYSSQNFFQKPTQDPRFVRLMEYLEPVHEKPREKILTGKPRDQDKKKEGEILYFSDVCLEKTCRIIFRKMRIN